jgi:undecaprenyl-diphosphatase
VSPWQAILLGIVEGLTEYLPVSSTGHLLLTQRALGVPLSETANAFVIAIQAGAIVAVLGVYRGRVAEMLHGLTHGDARARSGRQLLLALIVAFLPAAVLGSLFDETIERHLFGLWPVVAAWMVGGALILLLAGRSAGGEAEGTVGLRQALWIGCLQCLAMWPGTSRSLMTIAAGLLVGLGTKTAVEFSFLLGVVTLSAATAYKCVSHGGGMIEAYGASNLALGFAAALVSAVIAVRWMVTYLEKHSLAVFGYYRVLLALVVAVLLMTGVLSPT